jgi:superfamily II DNA/RNA helicase
MDNKKNILIISFLIIALAAGAAFFFYAESQKEVARIKSLKKDIEIVSAKRIDIIKEIEASKQEKEKLSQQLREYSENIQAYETELPELESEKKNVLVRLAEKEKLLDGLKDKQQDILRQEQVFREELEKTRADHEKLIEKLEYARNEKSELEEELKFHIQSSRGVELPRIVVKVVKPAKGHIVEVSKEYNFAVVDIGEEHGVGRGNRLAVYRNKKLIAKALIENVYEDMSSIVVLEQWRDADLSIGDSVELEAA